MKPGFGNIEVVFRGAGNSNLIDLDDNRYTTVIIGSQEWIVQNLKTTKYADGSTISNLGVNFYDDWFLPSQDEFGKMDTELHQYGVGNFTSDYYWTSSEYDATQAYQYNLVDSTPYFITKADTVRVRACRLFYADVGDYALRAIGPAGGLIFYTDGEGSYYEAAPSDQSAGKAWSNVTDLLIGTTGTAIGTGQANTTKIINQLEGNHGPVTDLDGNEYTTTIVNNQMWITENLKVTQYANTSAILKITDNSEWTSNTIGAYCAYDNDDNTIATNGLIYNGYALNKDVAYLKLGGVQELGWRTPLQIELNDNHISMEENGSFNNPPLGYRTAADGTFSVEYPFWWLEAQQSAAFTWGWILGSISSIIFSGNGSRKRGYAIRLVRDLVVIHTDSAAKLCNDLEAGGWIDDTVGAMCWYNNNAGVYKETYGALYNWYAVNNVKGLAYLLKNGVPQTGWRVATKTDLETLAITATTTGKLKEVGLDHWSDPNVGADNSIGFTALPGGIRDDSGNFLDMFDVCNIWTSTENTPNAWTIYLSASADDPTLDNLSSNSKNTGMSIRLVRDV